MPTDPCDMAVHFVLGHEGGYSTDPRDPGGETNFGISKRAHPDVDIAGLTSAKAGEIYRRDYWDRLGLDGLPPPLAIVTLDAAVNAGLRPAVNWLQAAHNDLSPHNRIRQDGDLGPLTRGAVTAWCAASPVHALTLAQRALERRGAFYVRLSRQAKFRPFLAGWVARVFDLGDLLSNAWAMGPTQERGKTC